MAGILVAVVAVADDGPGQREQVDPLEGRAAQFGIDAAGVGNVGYQPVDAAHVMARDLEQLRAQSGILDGS